MEAVCYKHPNVPGVAKCTNCGRPICRACIKQVQGAIFCGDACASRAASEADKVHEKLKKDVWQGGSIFGFLLKLALVAAAAIAAAEYFKIIDLTDAF
jgi:hypothetical protein